MLFNSLAYLVFFPVVLGLYWVCPRSWRRMLLLVASYIFYMSWIPVYGLLVGAMTLANYVLAIMLHRLPRFAKPLFLFGIVGNLACLFYFKYANFLISSLDSVKQFLNQYLPGLGAQAVSVQSMDIILPLGISFFAFEFIHYLTEVYKGGKPITGFVDFGLFAAFFPSQIAGPIKRYKDFVEQLGKEIRFKQENFSDGLTLLLQGLFKKVALADNLAILANLGFENSAHLGAADAWIATLAFTFQIYFDFSGYTDMGRCSALMLGFSLPDNFNFPYVATSLSDFWKRWHISLSSWLRDYLYIPLGGGRCSEPRKYFNLLTTMVLGGLWHGAAWHFVVWGAIHGVGLIVNHLYGDLAKRVSLLRNFHSSYVGVAFSWLLTFAVVHTCWVFFRAETSTQACMMLSDMFSARQTSLVLEPFSQSPVSVALTLYCIYALIFRISALRNTAWASPILAALELKAPAKAVLYACVLFAALGFAPARTSPFIYFQF